MISNLWFHRIFILLCIFMFCFWTHLKIQESLTPLSFNKFFTRSKQCYSSYFFNYENFTNTLQMIHYNAEMCSHIFKDTFNVDFINSKYAFRYYATPDDDLMYCKVLTLGLQKGLATEERLLLSYPRCKFFAVNLNNTSLFMPYKTLLNGTVIQAKFNDKNEITVNLNNNQVPLNYLLRNYYKFDKIDFAFMDINGTEMTYDMIENFKKYPIICQFTVLIYFPKSSKSGTKFLKAVVKTIKIGPYMIIKTVKKKGRNEILEVFFMNVQDEYCINKYII